MPALIVFLVLTALTLLLSLVFYFGAFYNPNRRDVTHDVLTAEDCAPFRGEMSKLISAAAAIVPSQEVYISSFDRKKLYGRVYFRHEGAPFHIQFNGYKGNGVRDFAGGLPLALKSGGNVLLVDQRAHGHSSGHTVTFGIKERRDVLSWIDYVNRTYGKDTPIFLEGVSMGAATVLMASGLDLPENVRGIVADCPYSSPFEIVNGVAEKILRTRYVWRPFVFLAALLYGRFNLCAASPLEAVKKTKVPVLLIHGTADRYVPCEMSRRIFAANEKMITFVEVEGAPHGLSALKDPGLYERSLEDFFSTAGGKEGRP